MKDLMRSFDPFEDFGRPFGSLFSNHWSPRLLEQTDSWMPPVDIRQTDEAYLVEVEVPGFKSDDIDVQAHENILTIQGERNEEKEVGEGEHVRRERRYGRFVRRFALPQGTNAEGIEAQVRDGVLTIRIPQEEQPQAKKIEVS